MPITGYGRYRNNLGWLNRKVKPLGDISVLNKQVRWADLNNDGDAIWKDWFFESAGGGVVVQSGVGQLTLTGFPPTIQITDNKTVLCDTGSLTLTGFAPTVVVTNNQFAQPGTGELVLSGFPPTVSITDNKVISTETGNLLLTGFPPTVAITDNKIIQTDTGSLLLTGFEPIVTVSSNGDNQSGDGFYPKSGSTHRNIKKENEKAVIEIIKIFLECQI